MEKGLTTNTSFWNFIKLFATSKGVIGNNDTILIHKKNIPDIVAKSSGIKPKTFGVNFENTSIQSV